MKRFLVTWALALMAILALAGGLNVVVNPYEFFPWGRIAGVNDRKPGIRNHTALSKAYQIERARPTTVSIAIGTSITECSPSRIVWTELPHKAPILGV